MEFEWDSDKAESNAKKHGIRFEVATAVFDDPNRITVIDDRFDYNEEWLVTLGKTSDGVLVVMTTERDDPPRIRIISARKANKREGRRYGNG
jgi:uncharacterized DUF497 family protein